MPLTTQPLAQDTQLDDLRRRLSINVSDPERIGSLIAGGIMLVMAARRRPLSALFFGGLGLMFLQRGATGHCNAYQALGINSRQMDTVTGVPDQHGTKIEDRIFIRRPRAELFRFWRNLENLSRFMHHVKFVEVLDDKRSRWSVAGPIGRTVSWTAEIINERQDELLAWESLPGAEVRNAGSVWFEDGPQGGTWVKVSMEIEPPAGAIGVLMAKLLGQSPQKQLSQDLHQLKQLMESGTQMP